MKKTLFILSTGLLLLSACKKDEDNAPSKTWNTLSGKEPLAIGHRGYPGRLPDHTLEGYSQAIDDGADAVEPDLVLTKDSILVARHEPMLSGTTNVADHPEFTTRKTKKMLDGEEIEDWFACDFTLAELKTLKAKQPLAERNQAFNGLYTIPTFEEVIALVKQKSIEKGRTVAVYPETKHPTFHENLKLHISDKLLTALDKAGWNSKDAPVYVQSFEVSNLKYIRSKSTVKIVQLFDAYDVKKDGTLDMTAPNGQPYDFVKAGDSRTYNDLATDAGLDFVKTYANGIGPWKPYIIPYTYTDANGDNTPDDMNADGKIDMRDYKKLPSTDLIARAHKRGLFVHGYTFRNEKRRLLSDYKESPIAEYKDFYDLGIDGVFSDSVATAIKAR
jgi:glycerophosphoryl diester phosphodiesterase